MNCTVISNCFQNQTYTIVEELTERVTEMYVAPGNLKNIRLIFPAIIAIGIFDHIRRAVSLSRHNTGLPSPLILRWSDFKIPIAISIIFGLSDMPNFLNLFSGLPTLIKVGRELSEISCPSAPDVITKLKEYTTQLNVNSFYFGTYFISVISIATMAMVTLYVQSIDHHVNGRYPHFKSHSINYYITFASLASLFIFQNALLYIYDLKFSPVDLNLVLKECEGSRGT